MGLASRPSRRDSLGKVKDGLVFLSDAYHRFFDELSTDAQSSDAVDGDTTPSVKGLGQRGVLRLVNLAPTNVTLLDDGLSMQEVVLLLETGNTTLINSATFRLSGGANINPPANSTLVMKRFEDGAWRQIGPVVTT